MNLLHGPTLRQQTRQALEQASYCPRRLTLIHTAGLVLLSVLQWAAVYFLSRQIASTGGLAGIKMRSYLETAQTVLPLILTVLSLFWEFGLTKGALQIARQEDCGPHTLAEGFRRFGPCLRLMLLEYVVTLAVVMLAMQAAMVVFTLTPLSQPLMAQLESLSASLESLDEAAAQTLVLELATSADVIPLYCLFALGLLGFGAPVFYRLRLTTFLILDKPGTGALAAMKGSLMLTRGNCLALFRIDLQFWWYYGLQILIAATAFADVALSAMGVSVPISADGLSFLLLSIQCVCQLALFTCFRSRVLTTYATAYLNLLPPAPATTPAE